MEYLLDPKVTGVILSKKGRESRAKRDQPSGQLEATRERYI
jgi:hypothetical protein